MLDYPNSGMPGKRDFSFPVKIEKVKYLESQDSFFVLEGKLKRISRKKE